MAYYLYLARTITAAELPAVIVLIFLYLPVAYGDPNIYNDRMAFPLNISHISLDCIFPSVMVCLLSRK